MTIQITKQITYDPLFGERLLISKQVSNSPLVPDQLMISKQVSNSPLVPDQLMISKQIAYIPMFVIPPTTQNAKIGGGRIVGTQAIKQL